MYIVKKHGQEIGRFECTIDDDTEDRDSALGSAIRMAVENALPNQVWGLKQGLGVEDPRVGLIGGCSNGGMEYFSTTVEWVN